MKIYFRTPFSISFVYFPASVKKMCTDLTGRARAGLRPGRPLKGEARTPPPAQAASPNPSVAHANPPMSKMHTTTTIMSSLAKTSNVTYTCFFTGDYKGGDLEAYY